MTATVQLSEEELRELCDFTRVSNADEAVRSALDEYRRYARRMRLKEVSGHVVMEENWRDLESAETDETNSH